MGARNAPTGISLSETDGMGGILKLIGGIFTWNAGNNFSGKSLQAIVKINIDTKPDAFKNFIYIYFDGWCNIYTRNKENIKFVKGL
jgi:hypothetical protein